MKITTVHDDVAGTIEITLAMRADADPDLTADHAWGAVTRALAADRPDAGTVPDGVQEMRA